MKINTKNISFLPFTQVTLLFFVIIIKDGSRSADVTETSEFVETAKVEEELEDSFKKK